MFGVGGLEVLVILVVAIIVFGPDQIPQVAVKFGKAWREFNRLRQEIHSTVQDSLDTLEEHGRRSESRSGGTRGPGPGEEPSSRVQPRRSEGSRPGASSRSDQAVRVVSSAISSPVADTDDLTPPPGTGPSDVAGVPGRPVSDDGSVEASAGTRARASSSSSSSSPAAGAGS